MNKKERAIQTLIEKTHEGELDWGEGDKTHYETEVGGRMVTVYKGGPLKLHGSGDNTDWHYNSGRVHKLYKAARMSARPEWVMNFFQELT